MHMMVIKDKDDCSRCPEQQSINRGIEQHLVLKSLCFHHIQSYFLNNQRFDQMHDANKRTKK